MPMMKTREKNLPTCHTIIRLVHNVGADDAISYPISLPPQPGVERRCVASFFDAHTIGRARSKLQWSEWWHWCVCRQATCWDRFRLLILPYHTPQSNNIFASCIIHKSLCCERIALTSDDVCSYVVSFRYHLPSSITSYTYTNKAKRSWELK